MCCDTNVFTGPQGTPGEDGINGAQGPQGPQGVPGPVGPTGLNWQGTFVPCVVYSENDAVSFDGSSYFVTCETTDGAECETPYDNTSCWGLLANEGAVGPMGPQGVQGLTGATGARGLTWRGAWVFSTFYSIDDAVSFNGTSYICISNSIVTTNPAITPLKWSVLAAKGAQGITGSTGPTGAAGPTGPPGPPGSGVPYKSHVSYIQFAPDGTPLNTEVFNDLEAGISFTQSSTGIYELTLSSPLLLPTKTIINPFPKISGAPAGVRLSIYNVSTGLVSGYYSIQRWNNNNVRMYFWDTSNNLINPYPILVTRNIVSEIKVYN